MGANPFSVALLLLGLAVLALTVWLQRPSGLFTGRKTRLPRRLEMTEVTGRIPYDAQNPLDYLAERLTRIGFEPAGPVVRIRAFDRTGHRLLVAPFVHPDERAYFLMGIESGLSPRSELMLHMVTPMTEGRRVETSTLPMLDWVKPPERVEVHVVLDADSVEEIWSRHRRALLEYERGEREPVSSEAWTQVIQAAYEAWLQAAVRAQRLVLEPSREHYRVRPRPKSVV